MIVIPEPRLWYILPGCLLDLSNGISEGIVLNFCIIIIEHYHNHHFPTSCLLIDNKLR